MQGEWTAVFKKGGRGVDGMRKNYCPVTSLTAVDKLFEQLLSHQLMCRYGKTLNSKMRAHRRNVLGLTDDRKLAFGTRQLVDVLSTDTSTTFDCLGIHFFMITISGRLTLWL